MIRPSDRDGMATDMPLFRPSGKAKYFLFWGLTRFLETRSDLPVGQICDVIRPSQRSARAEYVPVPGQFGADIGLRDNCIPPRGGVQSGGRFRREMRGVGGAAMKADASR